MHNLRNIFKNTSEKNTMGDDMTIYTLNIYLSTLTQTGNNRMQTFCDININLSTFMQQVKKKKKKVEKRQEKKPQACYTKKRNPFQGLNISQRKNNKNV